MSIPSAFRLRAVILCALFALLLAGCGVFEVGIEQTATPIPPTLTPPPTAIPSATPVFGRLRPGQTVRVIQTHMLNRSSGWALCQVETDLTDHILFTQDGGRSWQDRTPPAVLASQPVEGLRAAAFFDAAGNAWVTYSRQVSAQLAPAAQVVWRTTDQGFSWQPGAEFDIAGLTSDFFAISQLGFYDGQHGWALAHLGVGMSHDYIAIYTTADTGQTWQRALDPQKGSGLMACAKTGLAFSMENRGWLVGDCPGLQEGLFFYNTSDDGLSWQPVVLTPPAGQPAGLFSGAVTGCGIPSLDYSSARALLLTVRCTTNDSNKSQSWLYAGKDNQPLEARPLPLPFGTLMFISPDEGWMVGSQQNDLSAPGAIYHTTDGGNNWTLLISTAWQGRADFVDANTGWVIAQSADKLALVMTEDGGKTWQALRPVIIP